MLSLSPHLPPPPSPKPPPPQETPSLSSTAAVRLLTTSAAQRSLNLTAAIHASVTKSGLLPSNLFVANSLLNSYSKCGHPNHAQTLFDQMPHRDTVSYTSLISCHSQSSSPNAALFVFSNMISAQGHPTPNEFTVAAVLKACTLLGDKRAGQALHSYLVRNGFSDNAFVYNSLVDMYAKSGSVSSAEKLIGRSSCRDVVSWSMVISGCVLNGMYRKALLLFCMMLEDGVVPNLVTILSVVRACSLLNEVRNLDWVYAWVVKLGVGTDASVVNSLVEMYSKNGLVDKGVKVMIRPWILSGVACFDADAMAASVHGCAVSGYLNWGKEIHGFLIKHGFFPCTIIENSLIDMYAKNNQVISAKLIFEGMEDRDIISWNTMISCFARNDLVFEALKYLSQLHGKDGVDLVPDFVTVLSSVEACSEIASLQLGQILHGYIIGSGFNCDVFVSNALIDMYAKSGRIDLAEKVFEEMLVKDIGSWNSMIQAYGIHGDGNSALGIFTELKELREDTPNAITFVNVISACGHSGLTKEGYECFSSMQRDYGVEPTMEHYAAMVDLLGRAGGLKEAEDFIRKMPIEPGAAVWGALLGACRILGNVEVAERAAEKLSILEPNGSVWRVALSNIYALLGRWQDVGKIREEMKREGSTKEAGWSSVEVNGRGGIKFMVGDTMHPETHRIYEICDCIKEHITDAS